MATIFDTYNGPSASPITMEVITPQGVPVGLIGEYESAVATPSLYEADTLELQAPLTDVTALLLPCDGSVLVAYHVNDKTFLYMPADAEVHSMDGAPEVAVVTVTCAGGWTWLDGQVIPPSLEDPVELAESTEFRLEGNLENVVKRLITAGTLRLNHPLYVLTSQDRGPLVSVADGWVSTAEVVRDLLNGTGYYLDLQGWVPGKPYPAVEPFAPTVFVDVKPYRETETVWSATAGDLLNWTFKRSRAQATRVTLGYETDSPANREYFRVTDGNHAAAWHHREVYEEFKYEYPSWADDEVPPDVYRLRDQMEATALRKLAENGPTVAVDAEVDVANLWIFSGDHDNPRAFDLGDRITLDLPVLGQHRAVVTAVEISSTPEEFTVTPRVSLPDTMETDIFTRVAGLSRRVHNIERRT